MIVGILPCAGYGTRLAPLTDLAPKALMPIGGKPLVSYGLSILRTLSVGRIILVIGSHAQAVAEYVGHDYEGLPVEYVLQDPPQGLLDAIYRTRHVVEDRFLTLLSDEIYIGCDHKGFLQRWERQEQLAGLIGYVRTQNPERICQNYSIIMHGVQVDRMEEKPQRPTNDLLGTGTWGLGQSFFEYARFVLVHHPPERRSLVDALQAMIDDGFVMEGYDLRGSYVNVNSLGDVDIAEALVGASCSP